MFWKCKKCHRGGFVQGRHDDVTKVICIQQHGKIECEKEVVFADTETEVLMACGCVIAYADAIAKENYSVKGIGTFAITKDHAVFAKVTTSTGIVQDECCTIFQVSSKKGEIYEARSQRIGVNAIITGKTTERTLSGRWGWVVLLNGDGKKFFNGQNRTVQYLEEITMWQCNNILFLAPEGE